MSSILKHFSRYIIINIFFKILISLGQNLNTLEFCLTIGL